MIHIEVIQSPDINVMMTFHFHKNEVYLGRGAQDLAIADPSLRAVHVLLEVPEADLLVHPQKDVEFYLINGKRSTSIRKLKVGDILGVGKTNLKILGYEKSERPSKKDILNSKLSKLMAESSPHIPVIELLTKRMK